MASIQRMLSPVANAIVGSAMHVTGGKSNKIRPAYTIARGVRNRGPKKIKTNNKGLFIYEDAPTKTLIVKFNNERVMSVPMDEVINKLASPRKLGGKAVRSLLNRIFYAAKPGKRITQPMKQVARRMGLISAGIGGAGAAAAGTTGAYFGHKKGKKKGHEEGYISALEDVLSASKSTKREDIAKAISKIQEHGLSLKQLKELVRKQITVAPVAGLGIVREDLQPNKRKRYKKRKKIKKAYIPGISQPVGTTTPSHKPEGEPSRKTRSRGFKNPKERNKEPEKYPAKFTRKLPLTSQYIGTQNT